MIFIHINHSYLTSMLYLMHNVVMAMHALTILFQCYNPYNYSDYYFSKHLVLCQEF